MQTEVSQPLKHYGKLFDHRTSGTHHTQNIRPEYVTTEVLDVGATIDAPDTLSRGGQIAVGYMSSQAQWVCDFVVRGETRDAFPRWHA